VLAASSRRAADCRKDSSAHNRADTQQNQLHGSQCAFELVLGINGFPDQQVQGFPAKELTQAHGTSNRPLRLAVNIA
jgi:hypothetical protein